MRITRVIRVHAGVAESVYVALRAITGNGVNVLPMGAFYVAPQMGCDIADAYLNAEPGSGYEWWHTFMNSTSLQSMNLKRSIMKDTRQMALKLRNQAITGFLLKPSPEINLTMRVRIKIEE